MNFNDEDILINVADRIGAWICVGIAAAGFMVALALVVTH